MSDRPSLLRAWREIVGEVPGAVSLTFNPIIFSAGDPISVQLAHRDFDDAAGRRLIGSRTIIAEYPGTKDVADSIPSRKEGAQADPDSRKVERRV